ncbi:MAG: ABC transporter ATP-binding protein [Pseudomonadota bacterium]
MDPIIDICGLTLLLDKSRTSSPLVDGLSLSIGPGETLGLVGESGSGKSLTSLAIMGLLPKAIGATSGSIAFRSERAGTVDLVRLNDRRMRKLRGREIGMIFQEPMSAFSLVHKVGEQVAEPLVLHHGLSRKAAVAEAANLLDRVGVREARRAVERYPFEFSGGMLQRAMIARAVACTPRLIIADEPTTALDVTVQAQVLDLLAEVQREVGAAMLFITHDLAVASKVADRLAVLKNGRLVEEGPTRQTLNAPRHAYTKALIAALPRRASGTAAPATEADILTLSDLSVSYRESSGFSRRRALKKVLSDVSLTIKRGTVTALVGESGSGKTTLARAALGLIRSTGQVVMVGADGNRFDVGTLKGRGLRAYWRRAQMVFQNPYASLNPWQTIEETLVEPQLQHGLANTAKARDIAVEMLERCGLEAGMMKRFPHAFSGGQRQRIAIARALVVGPELLFCDEPLSSLDVSSQARIIELLKSLRRDLNLSVLLITHDLAVTSALCSDVAVMREGQIIEYGPSDEIFDRPRDPYTRRLIAAAPKLELT